MPKWVLILVPSVVAALSMPALGAGLVQDLNAVETGTVLKDTILVPFQGTWVQGPNTFIFLAGDTRDANGWIGGNQIGGGGQTNRYWWMPTGAATGTFYFDTAQGRQGPVNVQLLANNTQMKWFFGAETILLTRVN
jgi:hypothetical protein